MGQCRTGRLEDAARLAMGRHADTSSRAAAQRDAGFASIFAKRRARDVACKP